MSGGERGSAGGSGGGRRVLLTGGSGFIGSHVAERLLAEGRKLRCVVRASSDTSLLERLGAELVSGDLSDARTLSRAAEGCEEVVHCGALVSDWASVDEIKRVNVAATRALLEAAVAAGSERFLYVSSTDVYGHPGFEVDERYEPRRFSNWYAQSKLLAEREVWRAAAGGAIDVTVLRPATVYGPRSVGVIGEIGRALASGRMLLIDGGRRIAGLCHVENVCDLIALCLEDERARGEAFNASDELEVTWRTLTEDLAGGIGARRARLSMRYRLAHGLGFAMEHGYRALRTTTGLRTRPLLSRQAVEVMGVDQRFSAKKARELLGWEARVSYEEGLSATVDWLRSELRLA